MCIALCRCIALLCASAPFPSAILCRQGQPRPVFYPTRHQVDVCLRATANSKRQSTSTQHALPAAPVVPPAGGDACKPEQELLPFCVWRGCACPQRLLGLHRVCLRWPGPRYRPFPVGEPGLCVCVLGRCACAYMVDYGHLSWDQNRLLAPCGCTCCGCVSTHAANEGCDWQGK